MKNKNSEMKHDNSFLHGSEPKKDDEEEDENDEYGDKDGA